MRRIIEFETTLDNLEAERMRVRLKVENGKLADVMYQYESFINGRWTPIIRYDCEHGFFHRDVMHPNGQKEKFEIAIDSLKSASQYAEQDIKDHWEFYKERYLKKMKR